MLKSTKLNLYEILFHKENKWNLINNLILTNKIMIQDDEISKDFNSSNANEIKKIQDLKNDIIFLKEFMTEKKWPLSYSSDLFKKEIYKKFNENSLNYLEKEIKKIYNFINLNKNNIEIIIKDRINLVEKLASIKCLEEISPNLFFNLTNKKKNNDVNITYLIGSIPTKNIDNFNKIFFRLSRDNNFLKFSNLKYDINKDILKKFENKLEEKSLFVMILPFDEEVKINTYKKLINSLQGNFLDISNYDKTNKEEIKNNILLELKDNKKLYKNTNKIIKNYLLTLSDFKNFHNVSYLVELEILLLREEVITKEFFKIEEREDNIISIKFWIMEKDKKIIEYISKKLMEDDVQNIKPQIINLTDTIKNSTIIPSYHFTLDSDISKHFQAIVDTYAIPSHNESNPGLFTLISFPYLFGIMFGDFGHGSLFLFLSFFLFNLKKTDTLYSVRYLFLLWGIFSTFSGLIYNEFFSVPLPLFSSNYNGSYNKIDKDYVYPFGFDWIWFTSQNEITFFNSFKMKFSIIVGVFQMVFGIILKGLNSIMKKNKVDFFFEFIPQLLLMLSLFGFMSLLIIAKWVTNWENKKISPPSIIELFINIISDNEKMQIFGNYHIQMIFQRILVVIAVLSIFLMMIPKPIILIIRNNKKKKEYLNFKENVIQDSLIDNENNNKSMEDQNHESETTGEIIIHQLIETIEFVLGSISNTASYLRLWALSLAHGQLSKVFLDLILSFTYKNQTSVIASVIEMVILFPFFLLVTAGVILCMDFMECFLHTLRLHWVEFQNKFFKGNGIRFEPLKY